MEVPMISVSTPTRLLSPKLGIFTINYYINNPVNALSSAPLPGMLALHMVINTAYTICQMNDGDSDRCHKGGGSLSWKNSYGLTVPFSVLTEGKLSPPCLSGLAGKPLYEMTPLQSAIFKVQSNQQLCLEPGCIGSEKLFYCQFIVNNFYITRRRVLYV